MSDMTRAEVEDLGLGWVADMVPDDWPSDQPFIDIFIGGSYGAPVRSGISDTFKSAKGLQADG